MNIYDTNESDVTVLSYGGGVQSVAMCVLAATGRLPSPDHIVFADTGREIPSTLEYRATVMDPYLERYGMRVETAGHDLATVDLYAHNGDLLLPVFTDTGKLRTWCSNEWKASVCQRYLRGMGVTGATTWIGFSLDERYRVKDRGRKPWPKRFPLIDLMQAGLPAPRKSRCWMCPHQSNEEWREVRDQYPELFAEAVAMDEEVRAADEHGGVYLHASRTPLASADIDAPDRGAVGGEACGFGRCWL